MTDLQARDTPGVVLSAPVNDLVAVDLAAARARIAELEQDARIAQRTINELTELYKGLQQEAATRSRDLAAAQAQIKVYQCEHGSLRAEINFLRRLHMITVNMAVDTLRGVHD